ncbi:hypothetical protein, partial [Ruminococcus sp.]
SWHTLPFRTRVGEIFSFFASFFLFSKEKKKNISLCQFRTGKQKRNKRSKRCIKAKTIPKTNTRNINTAHTRKGKQKRLQAQGGQREKRAIPPDGFRK